VPNVVVASFAEIQPEELNTPAVATGVSPLDRVSVPDSTPGAVVVEARLASLPVAVTVENCSNVVWADAMFAQQPTAATIVATRHVIARHVWCRAIMTHLAWENHEASIHRSRQRVSPTHARI
jgi:hypothetical protein